MSRLYWDQISGWFWRPCRPCYHAGLSFLGKAVIGNIMIVRTSSWAAGILSGRAPEFSSPVLAFCADSFRYPFHSPVTAVASKLHGHSAKNTGGRLQLNTHAPYICGFAWIRLTCKLVHGCMLSVHRTCAETAAVPPMDLSLSIYIHVQGTSLVTTNSDVGTLFLGILQNALCKATVTHPESRVTRARWVCSTAVNSAI